MPNQDAIAPLVVFKGVRTDTIGDTVLPVPLASLGWAPVSIAYYGANGSQGLARIGLFTGANATGTTVRLALGLDAAGITGPESVLVLAASAGARALVNPTTFLYVNCGVASGVSGSTVDIAIYGHALP